MRVMSWIGLAAGAVLLITMWTLPGSATASSGASCCRAMLKPRFLFGSYYDTTRGRNVRMFGIYEKKLHSVNFWLKCHKPSEGPEK